MRSVYLPPTKEINDILVLCSKRRSLLKGPVLKCYMCYWLHYIMQHVILNKWISSVFLSHSEFCEGLQWDGFTSEHWADMPVKVLNYFHRGVSIRYNSSILQVLYLGSILSEGLGQTHIKGTSAAICTPTLPSLNPSASLLFYPDALSATTTLHDASSV